MVHIEGSPKYRSGPRQPPALRVAVDIANTVIPL
jgi:hypothetical protein